MDSLSQRTFRAGTSYELVVFDRLSLEEQSSLAELRAESGFYGILRPRPGSGRTVKAVGKETALLWLTLQSPGPLPFFALATDSREGMDEIPQLLLDGVLEVEENGRFLAGPLAAELMARASQPVSNGSQGRLGLLSKAALRYGESLFLNDPGELAGRLYGFGRQPVTPKWMRLLPDSESVLAFVGAEAGTDLRRRLDLDWLASNDEKTTGWLAWTNQRQSRLQIGGVVCKLYVSPAVSAMPQVFPKVLAVASARVSHFKIGSDAAGLLRPDKMVLYFRDREQLLAVATELTATLKGVEPHGVPFSAEIAADGLLSWGMDPPASENLLAWQGAESWRFWIVRRLAAAMIAAQTDGQSNMRPGEFALQRLRHEGVDVHGWTPSASIWKAR